MTEFCLFVCWRPRTYQRLVNDIFQSSASSKYDENVQPSASRVERLVEYAITYPNKLRFVTRKLDKRFMRSFLTNETGYVLIAVEVYRKILESYQKSQLPYMLEPHLNYILSECLRSNQIAYLRAAALLIKDCVRFHAFTTNISFTTAVLELCGEFHRSEEEAASEAQSLSYVGYTMLIPMLRVLHHNPHWLEIYLVPITTITLSTVLKAESNLVNESLTDSNITSVIIECQALLNKINHELPRSLSDVCWKTIASTCSSTSFAVIHTVMDTICQIFREKRIPVSSAMFLKVSYVVVTSFYHSSGHTFALDQAIMTYITTWLYNTTRLEVKRQREMDEESEKESDVLAAAATRDYHLVQDGSEAIKRTMDDDLHTLHETLRMILLWKTHRPVSNGIIIVQENARKLLSVDSFLHSMRSIFSLMMYLIRAFPFLMGVDLMEALETGEGPAAKLMLSVRSLPSALSLNSQPIITANRALTDVMSEVSEEVYNIENQQHHQVMAAMKMIYLLTKLTAEDCEPLGNNLTVLWDGLIHTIADIEVSKLHGKHNTNRIIPTFRIQAMYLCQIVLDKLFVDFQAIQIGAATSVTLISNKSWERLHTMVVDVNNWEELRHIILLIMKLVCVAQPIVKRMRESKDQAFLQAKQGSIIRGFSFYPFSPQQLHILQSIIFEDLSSMRGLCPLRIHSWLSLQSLLIRCFGEYVVIQELPMLLSLLNTCNAPCEENRMKQRAMYLRAYLLGYFLFVAGLCKIPELLALLQQWQTALTAVDALPKDVIFDYKAFSTSISIPDLNQVNDNKLTEINEVKSTSIPPLQPVNLLRKLLTNNRFQALTMYVTKAFEAPHPFLPFTEPLSVLSSSSKEGESNEGGEEKLTSAALSVHRRLFTNDGESDPDGVDGNAGGNDDASSVGSRGGVDRSRSSPSRRRSSTFKRKISRSGSSVAGSVTSGASHRNGGVVSKKGSLVAVERFEMYHTAVSAPQRTAVWRDQFAHSVQAVQTAQNVDDFLNLLR